MFGNKINLSCFIKKSIEENSNKENNIDDIIKKISNRIPLNKEDKENFKSLIKDIQIKGGEISKDGILTCYYALSKYNKSSYYKDGTVGAGSDKIVVSIKNNNNLKKFGEIILTLHIPIEKLYFVAFLKDTILLKLPFRSSKRKMNLKQYI